MPTTSLIPLGNSYEGKAGTPRIRASGAGGRTHEWRWRRGALGPRPGNVRSRSCLPAVSRDDAAVREIEKACKRETYGEAGGAAARGSDLSLLGWPHAAGGLAGLAAAGGLPGLAGVAWLAGLGWLETCQNRNCYFTHQGRGIRILFWVATLLLWGPRCPWVYRIGLALSAL